MRRKNERHTDAADRVFKNIRRQTHKRYSLKENEDDDGPSWKDIDQRHQGIRCFLVKFILIPYSLQNPKFMI